MNEHATVKVGNRIVRLAGRAHLTGRAAELAEQAPASNTLRVYAGVLRRFHVWSRSARMDPWEPVTVAAYLAHLHDGGAGVVAIKQVVTVCRLAYERTNTPADPESWHEVAKGAAREQVKENAPRGRGKAPALSIGHLHDAVRASTAHRGSDIDASARHLRDRAILLFGYLGAMRRSELYALDVSDIGEDPRGLVVTLRGNKNNQTDVSYRKMPKGRDPVLCPMEAWDEWMEVRRAVLPHLPTLEGWDTEPAWLEVSRAGRLTERRMGEDRALERIMHRALKLANIDPEPYTAHSLRAGLATELHKRGVPIADVAKVGDWRSLNTVLGYASRDEAWDNSPLHVLGY